MPRPWEIQREVRCSLGAYHPCLSLHHLRAACIRSLRPSAAHLLSRSLKRDRWNRPLQKGRLLG